MSLKVQVGFPKEDIRFVPGYAEKISDADSFTDGIIKLLTCRIVVSGFSQDYACAHLELRYEEEFDGGTTIDGVLKRAEKFAYDFCQKTGIGVV